MTIGALLFRGGRITFRPDSAPGLIRAWDASYGTPTTDGNGISSVPAAFGTKVTLTSSGTNEPDLVSNFGPNGQSIFDFDIADLEYFTFTTTPSLSAFTFFAVYYPKSLNAANDSCLITRVGSNCNIGFNTTRTSVSLRGQTASGTLANEAVLLPRQCSLGLNVFALTFDGSTGTYVAYLDGEAGTPTTGSNTLTYLFDQVGRQQTTAKLNAYVGVELLYNNVLSANNIRQVSDYLAARWIPTTIYVNSATGSDSNVAPWNSSTPWATVEKGITGIKPGQTLALDDDSTFRPASKLIPAIAGLSGKWITVNGNPRSTARKAEIRWSTAATPTLISGTIYSLSGTYATDPGTYIFYVPGGVPTWDTSNFYATNVVRWTKTAGTQTAPGVGEWGRDVGTSKLYVNGGEALSAGDIEVSTLAYGSDAVNPLRLEKAYWDFRNVRSMFALDKGWDVPGTSHLRFTGIEGHFNQTYGFALFAILGAATDITITDPFMSFNGPLEDQTSGYGGVGLACHDGVVADILRPICVNNDKSQAAFHSDTFITLDKGLLIGSWPCVLTDPGSGVPVALGSLLVTNTVIVVPTGVAIPIGINAKTGGSTVVQAINNTIISRSGGTEGSGFAQSRVPSNITGSNNIVVGFGTGIQKIAGGTIDLSYSCLYGNSVNYSGVSAGTGDITSNPLFVASATGDYRLDTSSPCIDAGTNAGITTDHIGTSRPQRVRHDIGAYEKV